MTCLDIEVNKYIAVNILTVEPPKINVRFQCSVITNNYKHNMCTYLVIMKYELYAAIYPSLDPINKS